MIEPRVKSLLDDKNVQKIFSALNGFETRFVGGCVRDALLDRTIGDIDLATTALPQQVMDILTRHKIQVIPTGIDHGTVTAVIDKKTYEITTLRKDVTTDGRRATVAFSNDWQEDALRRDFTINALSVDASGKLYDYFDGQADLANKTLRFIGEPEQRIQEDYLRILRFFRFASVLDWDATDKPALQACSALAPHLKSLSRERVQTEFFKLLLGKGCLRILHLMVQHDILDVLVKDLDITRLEKTISMEQQHNETDSFRRLLALVGWQQDPEFIVLSRDNKNALKNLRKLESFKNWPIEKQLYFFGQETVKNYYYLANKTENYNVISSWQKPTFPIKANDVFHLTNGPGEQVGLKLALAETYWVDNGFQPSKQELLKLLESGGI